MLDMGGFTEPGVPVLADPGTRRWDQFMDLRDAGATKLSFSRSGIIGLPLGSATAPPLIFGAASPPPGIYGTNTSISFSIAGAGAFGISTVSGVQMGALLLGWGSSFGVVDLALNRDASDILAQRRTTVAQTWRLYNTYTDASNYERLSAVAASAADFKLIPEAAGTGTLRGLQLGVSGGKLGFYGTTAIVKPAALTAADATTVDVVYGAEESGVINNLRTRVNELESKLQALGLLT